MLDLKSQLSLDRCFSTCTTDKNMADATASWPCQRSLRFPRLKPAAHLCASFYDMVCHVMPVQVNASEFPYQFPLSLGTRIYANLWRASSSLACAGLYTTQVSSRVALKQLWDVGFISSVWKPPEVLSLNFKRWANLFGNDIFKTSKKISSKTKFLLSTIS